MVPAPIQHFTKKRQGLAEHGNIPADWSIAKTRARVEHPFAQMRLMGGELIGTIGQAGEKVAITMMAAYYNLKRPAKFLDDGVDVFYNSCASKMRGMPARGQCLGNRGKNALEEANLLKKIGQYPTHKMPAHGALKTVGFRGCPKCYTTILKI